MVDQQLAIVKGFGEPARMPTGTARQNALRSLRLVTDEEFSSDPRVFIPAPYDISSRLESYIESHREEERDQVSIARFPSAFAMYIDGIAPEDRYYDLSAKVGCILECAMDTWDRHPAIKNAAHVKAAIDLIGQDPESYTASRRLVIYEFYKGRGPASLNVDGDCTKRNPKIPKSIKTRVATLSKECGIDMSELSIVSIMAVMCRESCVDKATREEYADKIVNFITALGDRSIGISALMRAYLREVDEVDRC